VNSALGINLHFEPSSCEDLAYLTQSRSHRNLGIVGLALIALMLKLVIAFNTVGTNDAVAFYQFGKALNENGLEWTYRHNIYFNHPPLIAYYLRGIYLLTEQRWCQDLGIHFPFLLRLPGIIADFLVVLILLRLTKMELHIPTWALALFALSPVSLMVSGFHGNTDPVMVMFLMLASLCCLRGKSVWCALFAAFSCEIKIISLLLLPIFFFFWMSRNRARSFSLAFLSGSFAFWAEPLLKFPTLFTRNVLLYGGYWGLWGITYWLRVTNLAMFKMEVAFYDTSSMEALVALVLKLVIIVTVLLIAWRRRNLGGRAPIDTVAYAWIVFFVFAPAVCAQYLVWLAPFALVLCPAFYGWVVASSSIFLFFFYNINAGGLPWYSVISNGLHGDWAPWSLWPWAVFVASLIIFVKNAHQRDPSLRLLSFKTLPMRP
jgi:hypothetical protein